jgi:hypothetical protein
MGYKTIKCIIGHGLLEQKGGSRLHIDIDNYMQKYKAEIWYLDANNPEK